MSGQATIEPASGRGRKERILTAAADLVAQHGYHAVSMADIGAAAGIVGPGIYRHFSGKSALLVALFDRVIDGLLARASKIVTAAHGERSALTALVADHVTFVVESRELAMVYYREVHNLPVEDRSRLRRKQRLYLEEWVHVVAELRRDLDDAEVRSVVHCAISAMQSALHHRGTGLTAERVRELLVNAGHAVLGVEPATEPGAVELPATQVC